MTAEERWRNRAVSSALTLIGRMFLLRDRIAGVTRRMPQPSAREEIFFPSGDRTLHAILAAHDGAPLRLLICHGIGETVGHWSAVQAFLLDRGVGSMVFNYSGYARSTGSISPQHCDRDLAAAYAALRLRTGPEAPVAILGFSLGSGIAAGGAGALTPPPARLFLCEAFTSFREAAVAAGLPRPLAHLSPNIWDTVAAVRTLRVPVTILHSDADTLFPIAMAQRIASACAPPTQAIVVSGLAHNEPYLHPTETYWKIVIDFAKTHI